MNCKINIKNMRFMKSNGGGSGRKKNTSPINDIKPTDAYKKKNMEFFNSIVEATNNYWKTNVTEKDLQDFEKGLQELMSSEDTHIGIRINNDILDKIFDDGRFKSQLETGTSNGILDIPKRKNIEHDEMSYSKKTPVKNRPIYGMLFNYKKLSNVEITDKYGDLPGSHYGNVIAIMKHSVKSYSTVTIGDSFDGYKTISPSPLLKPSRYSCDIYTRTLDESIKKVRHKEKLSISDFEFNRHYVEAQIHKNQATTSNIQHLIFGKSVKITAAQKSRLKSLGITWSREGSNKIY